jgi:hypothetical protein
MFSEVESVLASLGFVEEHGSTNARPRER